MRSVRLPTALEEQLTATARTLKLTESEVIRLALERFCGAAAVEVPSAVADTVALIEQWEREDAGADLAPVTDLASQASRIYEQLLHDNWREAQNASGVRQVAERKRAPYRIPGAPH